MTEQTAAQARRQKVIEDATGVFFRYGYGRTTMGDIAQAAGLTRPTLYQTFADKEAVFKAVVETLAEQVFGRIRAGLTDCPTLESKLLLAFNAWGADGFELVLSNPDAKDMFDLCFAAVQRTYDEFAEILLGILTPALAASNLGIKPADLARIMIFGVKGFKATAQNGADMRAMIAGYVAVVVAGIEAGSR
jgi:AcrR family transcriptional regulator